MKIAPPAGTRHSRFSERTTKTEMVNHGQANHPTLDNINPYDGDPETQAYLHLGCLYLALEQAKKYESESVQESVKTDYYHSCLNAVWPGHTYHIHVLEKGERFCSQEKFI